MKKTIGAVLAVGFLVVLAACATHPGTAAPPAAPEPAAPVATPSASPKPGVACGDKVCAASEVCCNASCGICTPPGAACIQEVCSKAH